MSGVQWMFNTHLVNKLINVSIFETSSKRVLSLKWIGYWSFISMKEKSNCWVWYLRKLYTLTPHHIQVHSPPHYVDSRHTQCPQLLLYLHISMCFSLLLPEATSTHPCQLKSFSVIETWFFSVRLNCLLLWT